MRVEESSGGVKSPSAAASFPQGTKPPAPCLRQKSLLQLLDVVEKEVVSFANKTIARNIGQPLAQTPLRLCRNPRTALILGEVIG
jgi:hypothetical protein